jgi:putative flippase GtrA
VNSRWHALIRYLVIGFLSITIDVGLLFVLHQLVGVDLGIATAVAFIVSLIFNFTMNRSTMSSTGVEGMTRHVVRFGVLVVANLAITVTVVTLAADAGVPYLVAKLAVVATSTAWNFVLYRHWVFTAARDRNTTVEPTCRTGLGEGL